MRFEVRETNPGYGVWDNYLYQWVEPELGTATGLFENDAEDLARVMNRRHAHA